MNRPRHLALALAFAEAGALTLAAIIVAVGVFLS